MSEGINIRALFQTCPAPGCGKKLRWRVIDVTGGTEGDDIVVVYQWAYADCTCGYGYEWRPDNRDLVGEQIATEEDIDDEDE